MAVVGLLGLAGCKPAPPPEPPPVADLAGLAPGWNTIEPGGATTCSDGTPYKFLVRPGDPAKLVVYFQGGGGCFDGRTCDPDVEPTYTVNLEQLDLARYDGIFAFANAENPFADSSFVFAPYCTADVHIGNRDVTYQAPAGENHPAHDVTIHHRGAANAAAVLAWTEAHFFRPESVFVTGSSAGSAPARGPTSSGERSRWSATSRSSPLSRPSSSASSSSTSRRRSGCPRSPSPRTTPQRTACSYGS
jgi:hypothetical protein